MEDQYNDIPPPQTDPIDKLYKTLVNKGYYTKSFDEFKKKYSTPEAIDKIYGVVSRDQLYTKSKDDFYNQYFPQQVKKKVGGNDFGDGLKNLTSYGGTKLPSNGQLKLGENKWVKPTIPEALKKDKEEGNSALGGVYNTLVGSVARLFGGIGELGQSVSKGVIPNADVLPLPSVRKPIVDFIEKARTSSSSRENEQARSQFDITNGVSGDDVKALLFQAPSQILDMIGGAMTYGSSFFLQAVNDSAKELEESPNADKLSNEAKLGYTYLNATLQGALDRLAVFKILKSTGVSKKVQQKLANEIVDEFVKKGIKATAADIEKAALAKAASFASKVKKVGLKAATGFGYESVTEAGQQAGSDALKLLTNKVSQNEIFDEEDITANFGKNVINAGAQGGIFGKVVGAGSQILNSTNKAIRNEIANAQTPEDVQKIQQQIAEQVELGNITPEEAQAANIKAEQYAKIAARIPETVEPEKKYAIIGGIEQREGLSQEISKAKDEMKSIDPAFQKEHQDKIDLLNAKLEQTNDYIEGLVTGKKTTYRKETKEGEEKYYKTDSEGKETAIPKEYYELATAIREEEARKKKEPEQQPQEKTLTEEEIKAPTETQASTVSEIEKPKVRVTAEQLEERQPEKIRQRYIDDFNIVEDSKFDWRVTSQLSSADRKKAVADIKAGKVTAASKKLNQEIDEMMQRGTVIINRGRGNQAQTVEIPIDEWFKFTPIEHDKAIKAAESTPDEIISIIRDNDITLQNIDNLKDLFNGFPYDETDFTNVKAYLQGEATRNAETARVGEQSQTKEVSETLKTTPEGTQPKPTEEKSQPDKGAAETPPPPTGETTEAAVEGGAKMGNKSLATRLVNSNHINESAKKKIESKGLKYPVASKEEARSVAKGIIQEFGIEEAVAMAEGKRFYRGVNSAIFAEALDSLYTQEKAAKSKGALSNETTLALADQWSDIALRYDEWLRDFGTEISFVADFYKKSPLGVKLAERKKRDAAFKEWYDKKEKNFKEVFEELQKDPEFEKFFKEKVEEELKKERSERRAKRRDNIDKFFDDLEKNIGEGTYVTIIPPPLMKAAVRGMKKAFLAGESVVAAVEKAISEISDSLGHRNWDIQKFKDEYEEKLRKLEADRKSAEELYQESLRKQIKELDEQIANKKRTPPKEKDKKQWSDETKKLIEERDAKKKELNEKVPKISLEEKQQKFLEKWAKKLEGLSQKEKAEVIRRSFTEIIENGALKYDKFKDIIADVLGLGKLSEADSAKMEKYVEDMNSLDDYETKAVEAKTDAEKRQAIKEYEKAHERAERSATDLAAILYNKPDIINRLATIMQLKTLTATSLIKNPVYNMAYQATQRFWVASTLSILDQAIYQGSKVMNKVAGTKVVQPDFNVIASQKYYWDKMAKGWQVAIKQLFTGTTSRDYFQKEIYSQQIKPAKSWRDLIKSMRGELHLTGEQKLDKILQGTIGVEAEMVARLLNIGDKPFRFGAEASIASIEANRLGLKGADKELFMAFPKKMAYKEFKKKGLSDEKAQEKAEVVEKRIIREGEQAVFQQDNVVGKVLEILGQGIDTVTDKALGEENAIAKGVKGISTIVGKAAMPFRKVPLNAAWELINVVVPELALAQSVFFSAKAGVAKSKGQESARLDYISAKKWLATAIVGIGLQAVTNWLFQIGAVSGEDDDEDKKERDAEKLYTRPRSINISKVMRVISGGSSDSQEGDLLVDNSWFGNVGIMANIQNNIRGDMTPEEKEKLFTLFNDLLTRMDLAANEAIENGVFSTSMALLKAYSDRNTGFGNNVLMNMINTGTNLLQSGTFAQWSRAQIPYEYRLKGDTFWQQLHNNMAARSGLYRTFTGHYPPARVSIWGEKMDRDTPVFMQQLGMKKNDKDNFAQPIWDDYEKNHNLKLWPPSVPKTITVNSERKKLNIEQQDKLQQFVGLQRQSLVAPFVNGLATITDENGNEVSYSGITDEKLKVKYLQLLYKQGYKQGKILFQLANPEFMPKNPEEAGEEEPENQP